MILCCLQGRTRDEAAEQLGWTPGSLKMRLERGRQLLRARLARRGLTAPAALLALLAAQPATASPVPAALYAATVEAAVAFALVTTPAGLSAQVARLADLGLATGAGKVRALGAAGLLGLLGATVGLVVAPKGPEPSKPAARNQPVPPRTGGRADRAVTGRFADATEEAGLDALLRRHHARFPGWQPTGATLLDADGDGRLALHLAGQADGFAALGRNAGGRFVSVDPRPELPRGPREHADLPYPGGQVRQAFDVNEDGRLDLAVSWHNYGAALYHNATAGADLRFRRAPFVQPEFPDVLTTAFADVDRDGTVDLLVSSAGQELAVHRGRGDGTYSNDPSAVLQTGLQCPGAIPVDLDGDGRLELIARQTAFDAPACRKVFREIGPLKWTDVTLKSGLAEPGSVHGVGELDGDGDPDLIGLDGQQVVLDFNNGKGRFARRTDAVSGLERAASGPHPEWGDRWGGAVVADFDNDGVPDVVINGRYFLYVLRGTGGGRFEYANDRWGLPDFAYCDVDDGLCFGGVDGDGRLDLVVATGHPDDPRRPVGLFVNQTTDHHWLRVHLVGRPGNAAATGATIRVREAGDPGRLVAAERVAVWGRQSFHSYYAARRTERHFGLGRRTAVDVTVELHPSGRRVVRRGVPADRTVVIAEHDP